MSNLAERIVDEASKVHLALRWLDHDNIEQAREALAGVHDRLVAIAEEVDR